MLPPDDHLASEDKAALITELKRVDAAHDILLVKYSVLELENEALKARLAKDEKTKRTTFRSATPFSKQAPKADPKPPGRKPGQGNFTNRSAPLEHPGDEIIRLDAPLASPNCPQCDTPLEITIEQPTTIDIPAQPRRVIKKWRRQIGLCPKCGKRCLGQHPDLPANQTGATAHRAPRGTQLPSTNTLDPLLPRHLVATRGHDHPTVQQYFSNAKRSHPSR